MSLPILKPIDGGVIVFSKSSLRCPDLRQYSTYHQIYIESPVLSCECIVKSINTEIIGCVTSIDKKETTTKGSASGNDQHSNNNLQHIASIVGAVIGPLMTLVVTGLIIWYKYKLRKLGLRRDAERAENIEMQPIQKRTPPPRPPLPALPRPANTGVETDEIYEDLPPLIYAAVEFTP